MFALCSVEVHSTQCRWLLCLAASLPRFELFRYSASTTGYIVQVPSDKAASDAWLSGAICFHWLLHPYSDKNV